MKSKILIIEDEREAYTEIIESLAKDKYEFIPSNTGEFKPMITAIKNKQIKPYIGRIIEDNYEWLRVIICDLKLLDDPYAGGNIIRFIRRDLELPTMKLFPKLVPIISYTQFSDTNFAKIALESGATHNIRKGSNTRFPEVVDSMCDYFKASYIDRDFTRLDLLEVSKTLEESKDLIRTGFDDLEFLINANHEVAVMKLDLLFRATFKSMDKNKQQSILDSFKKELTSVLAEDEIDRIETSNWEEIRGAIRDASKDGGFKAFVDSTYDILDNAGLLDSKGKIIGSAIKGIFGVIAS